MDRHRRDGRRHGLPPHLRRLCRHYVRPHPLKCYSSTIPRPHLVSSPAELAALSDVVFTMVGHSSDVKHVVIDTLLPSVNPNTVIIDHTSSHPALARQIYESALEKQCDSVDAPVSECDRGYRREIGEVYEAARDGAAGSMAMELFGHRMIKRDFRLGGFAQYMVKDLGLGVDVEEGDEDNAKVLPGAVLSKQLFSGMVANGDEKLGTQG
ncbi:probable 3-hydroxyisobutyrate dehydrogenase-like 2, mitochondrial [Olea europaea subsp. europaea]|uniref:Probable 3-hydroxyisobutyrate dehydrogenase-like 2, mitochondrial n=1 Tax=Olea europaea subsp. europaea TaxID=158383 RepID=A0A8S0SZL4_OLEEU|nr:probable 3-hydroxyisobutyrate dehydrogenase-like 2, mitochondrial [Olea europaea subsp. europaea]